MTSLPEREVLMERGRGAASRAETRLAAACGEVGMSVRTCERVGIGR